MIADAILVVHFAIVLFIVGGLAAVWIGAARGLALDPQPVVSLCAPRRNRVRRRRRR